MPIHDYAYRTYAGERRGARRRWLAIPKFHYLEAWKGRLFISLMILSSLQFLARSAYFYILANLDLLEFLKLPTNQLPAVDAFFFKTHIDLQAPFCFSVAFMLGAGLISRDLQRRALVLIASKPVSLWEYVAGKFAVVFAPMIFITAGQGLLLLLLQRTMSAPHSAWRVYFWRDYAWLCGPIAAYSLVVSLTLSLMILAASSVTKNPRLGGIIFAVYALGGGVGGEIVSEIFRNQAFQILSPLRAGYVVGQGLFGLLKPEELRSGLTPALAVLSFLLHWGLCSAVIAWRVREGAELKG